MSSKTYSRLKQAPILPVQYTKRPVSVGYCRFLLNNSAVVSVNKGGAKSFPSQRSMHLKRE